MEIVDSDRDYFKEFVRQRINANKNLIMVLTGPTGSGKSWSALRLGYDLSQIFGRPFSADNVAFQFREFIHKINSDLMKGRGNCLLFDEVGATGGGGSSREWQSRANKMFFGFLQTARARNDILILTVPDFSFLDLGARKLCHIHMLTAGIDRDLGVCKLKPFQIQVNQRSGKIYEKYIRVLHPEYGRVPFVQLLVKKPPKEIKNAYEYRKEGFMQELYRGFEDEEEPEKAPAAKQPQSTRPLLDDIDRKIIGCLEQGQKAREIGKKLNMTFQSIYYRLKKMEERGLNSGLRSYNVKKSGYLSKKSGKTRKKAPQLKSPSVLM